MCIRDREERNALKKERTKHTHTHDTHATRTQTKRKKMSSVLSRPEFQFTRDGISQNLRADGRENRDSRPVEISLGNHRTTTKGSDKKEEKITRAVGQARVRFGRGTSNGNSDGTTEVVCAITGQVVSFDDDDAEEEDEEEDALLLFMGQQRRGRRRRREEGEEEGRGGERRRDASGTKTGEKERASTSLSSPSSSIEVHVETMSTRNVGSAKGGGTSKGQHQQQVFNETDKYCGALKRELEFAYGSLDLVSNKDFGLRKSLEIGGGSHASGGFKRGGRRRHRWKLRMDFLVLSDDGNALDALAIAGKCALFDTRLPKVRVKRRGEDEEVELVSDSEEEEEERKESNSNSSNTTLDISDVPLIATATYFGRARQQDGVAATTIKIDGEEFLPTIAIDCVSSEETCGDYALAVSATKDGAVTSVQRVGGVGNSSAMAVESDVSDNVIKFARLHCVKVHGEIDSYLSTLVLRDEDEDEDSLASSESEDEEMEEADQDEFR